MSSEDLPEFLYRNVEDWFVNLLAPTIERRLDAAGTGTLTWCPNWWEHAEAIARLEALWRAWEVCRDTDGESPARWFWQHCDPMLSVLMDAKVGPMSDCKPTEHRKYTNALHLPITAAPRGYWGTTVAATTAQPPAEFRRIGAEPISGWRT
ncbi:uncharacterized protein DUF4913 [Jatrophihabitans sp. GAS493]|uniref:DUF4913 domain-containing protein n=1 Tax=Jatrophihabitans sp. GAS493 TaxID=1907575 RepID=UPI000BB9501B|nr:DUF4913 domain-containing protein [Jatrophihabitans sp. GAS493]SOD72924.1 uncharacterized protein DUF4913 [Jatrophihabitans sp. GAS493]